MHHTVHLYTVVQPLLDSVSLIKVDAGNTVQPWWLALVLVLVLSQILVLVLVLVMVLALVLVLVLGLVLTVDTMDISVATLATLTSWWLSVMLVRHFCNWQLSAGHCLRLYSVSAVPTTLLVTIYCCSLQCDAVWQSTDWMCITLTRQTTTVLQFLCNKYSLAYLLKVYLHWHCECANAMC